MRGTWCAVPFVMLTACYASHALSSLEDASVGCDGDGWFAHEWVLDGRAGASGCHAASAILHTSDGPPYPYSDAQIGYATAGVTPRGDIDEPACGLAVRFIDMPIVTGARGMLASSATGSGPRVVANVAWARSPGGCSRGDSEEGVVTSGEWRVLQGGSAGAIIEVEITDVTVEPFRGHTLSYPRAVWRAELLRGPHYR